MPRRNEVCYSCHMCNIDGCESPATRTKNTLCEKHYYRLRRTGTAKRKQEPIGVCYQCGRTVEGNAIICSSRCRDRRLRGRSESPVPCRWCRGDIPSTEVSSKIYCSITCRNKWRYHNVEGIKEQYIVYWNNRRARKKDAEGFTTPREWDKIQEFYGNVCLSCGSDGKMTVDHVVPLSMGGTNGPENIQPLCLTCNLRKHVRTIDYRPDKGLDMLASL